MLLASDIFRIIKDSTNVWFELHWTSLKVMMKNWILALFVDWFNLCSYLSSDSKVNNSSLFIVIKSSLSGRYRSCLVPGRLDWILPMFTDWFDLYPYPSNNSEVNNSTIFIIIKTRLLENTYYVSGTRLLSLNFPNFQRLIGALSLSKQCQRD